jgi:hypothetical protein
MLWDKVTQLAGFDLPPLGDTAASDAPALVAREGDICRPGETPAVPTAAIVPAAPAKVAMGG